MVKQKQQATHQTLVTHTPTIEKVRTHIRTHCQSEMLIRQLLETLDLNAKEFDAAFKSTTLQPYNPKKKPFVDGKNSLRAIVGTHLHHLICLAKLKEFKEKLKSKRMQQKEIDTLIKTRPDLAREQFDFSKKISPEQAMNLLADLEQKTGKLEKAMFEIFSQHQTNVETFTDKRHKILDELSAEVKTKDHALSAKELSYLFKVVSELAA